MPHYLQTLDPDLRAALHTQLRDLFKAGEELLPEPDNLEPFTELCRQAWQATIELVEEVRKRQEERLTSRN